MEDFPRRNQLDKCTPAELAIYNAMEEVEKAGADLKLTNAVIKLDEARNLVADFIDGVTTRPGFLERLIDEKNEVDGRIGRLEVFFMKDKSKEIEPEQISLLNIQLQAMKTYSQCLHERLVWLQK